MKKTLVILTWVGGFIVLTPIVLFLAYFYFSRAVVESKSPSGVGSAILYQDSGMLDTTMSLCVRDYKRSGSEPIGLGMVGDWGGQGIAPEKVVWSKDGSVVAAKRDGDWIAAYDFGAHRTASDIGPLLASRGGEGETIISGQFPFSNFDIEARHVWWWENYPSSETLPSS